jgi:magnesium chelatase subunit I
LKGNENEAVPRVSDLESLAASTQGKVEIEALDEREGNVIDRLMKASVLTVFKDRCKIEELRNAIQGFDGGMVVHTGDDMPSKSVVEVLTNPDAEGLQTAVYKLVGADATIPVKASAVEFLLEGLHLSKRLNKDSAGSKATYRAR